MQTHWQKLIGTALDRRPNVGRLMALCEDNYALFVRLVPGLRELRGRHVADSAGHADLHLEVLEQSRFTSVVHLTYVFDQGEVRHTEPDAVLRIYHDARQLEVVELRQSDAVLSAMPLYERPGLSNKWQLNLFIGKWLAYCVATGYRFLPVRPAPEETQLADIQG